MDKNKFSLISTILLILSFIFMIVSLLNFLYFKYSANKLFQGNMILSGTIKEVGQTSEDYLTVDFVINNNAVSERLVYDSQTIMLSYPDFQPKKFNKNDLKITSQVFVEYNYQTKKIIKLTNLGASDKQIYMTKGIISNIDKQQIEIKTDEIPSQTISFAVNEKSFFVYDKIKTNKEIAYGKLALGDIVEIIFDQDKSIKNINLIKKN